MYKLFTLLVLFAIAGCSTSEKVGIKESNIPESNQIEERQNIVITFDRDLAPDSLLSRWDTTSYFNISPRVRGTYKWTGKNELTFSPYEGFEPNTDYTLSLNDNLLKYNGGKMELSSDNSLKFHTEYFRLENVTLKWQSSENQAIPGIQMTMFFNHNINPAELDSILEVSIGSNYIPFRVMSTEPDNRATVLLRTVDPNNLPDDKLTIKLKKGLAIEGTRNRTFKDYTVDENIPSIDKLIIEGASTNNDNEDLGIQVMTNQELAPDQNIKNFITLKPEIDFSVEQNEYGFFIKAAFDPSVDYELTISGSLRGIAGRPLTNEYKTTVSFSGLPPMVQFSSPDAMYLSSKGTKYVGLKIFGTSSLTVTVAKVYENNILTLTRRGKEWKYDYENDEYNDYETYVTDDVGDVVYTKTYETKDLPRSAGMYLLNLNFKDVIPNYDGIYVVKAESNEMKWLQDSRIIAISDIGLVVKQSDNQVLAYVNSIKTGEAMPGVKVKLISSNNQPFATKETDGEGIAMFDLDENRLPHFTPMLISAKIGDDVNYMILDAKTNVDNSKFKVISGIDGKGYKTFLYGDRDLYRPDDTLTIAGIIRDDNWKPLSEGFVKAELLMPNSKVYKEMKVMLNKQGGFAERLYLPGSLVTGIYTVRVSLPNGTVLKTRRINIEDFIPDRIKVNIMSDKDSYSIKDPINIKASVYNLFGPPAANRNYEFNVKLVKKDFMADDFPNYDFQIHSSSDKLLEMNEKNGKTSKEGLIYETVSLPSELANMGLIQANTDLTVFDETNRTVSRNLLLNVYTQDVFIGIGNFDNFIGTGKRLSIPVVAVDRYGKVAGNYHARVSIIKKEWETIMRRNTGNNYLYESQVVEKTISDRDEYIKGPGYTVNFRPVQSGSYEIRIYNPGAETYVSREFYSYTFGGAQDNSFEVNKEGRINISLDKPLYRVGETAKVLFKTPFQGKLLVTLERNGIIEHRIIQTDNKAAEMTLPVKKEYLPNIYISATLLKPLVSEEVPLTCAYGYACLMAEEPSNKLPVTITASEQSRSNKTQKITVQTAAQKDVFVTIAAVDEGILQVKNYKTPDPYGFFYQKISLGLNTYSLYPYLFPDLKIASYSYGAGDEDEYDLMKRLNPLTTKRVKLLSLWSGVIKANGSGKVSWDIDIPEFSGSVRIMACAYAGNSFGSAEKIMTVSDPVVISAALPRFLSPGDEIQSQFTLSNTTRNTETVKTRIYTDGPVRLQGSEYSSVTIEPNTEKQVYFKLQALNNMGDSKVVINAESGGEKFTQTTELGVRPAASLQKTDVSGVLNPGESNNISPAGNFIKESVRSQYIVCKSPIIEFARDLRYLVEYPYGCLEQTVSTAFPQIAYADIINLMGDPNDRFYIRTASENVRYAIDKIQSMQIYNGGLTLWPGGTEDDWWSTAYAAHFLIEARKAGYEINNNTLERILRYLSVKAANDKPSPWYWWENGKKMSKETYSRESVYSLFVLAIAGRPEISHMNLLRSRPEMLTDDSRFMLAATFKLAGGGRAQERLIQNVSFVSSVKQSGGSFASPTRDLAVALYTLQICDPSNAQIPRLVQHLTNQLKHEKYLSTQDRSFSLIALANSAKENAGAVTKADIYSNGKLINQMSDKERLVKDKYGSQDISVKNTGSGRIYYFAERSGIPSSGMNQEGDNFIRVRRQFLTRDGKVITGNKFRQGDLILVKIRLESMYNENIDNIVITDLLPAGFEIENPRLNNDKHYDWIKDASTPVHYDYRDDRINIFCNLEKVENPEINKDQQTAGNYYYMVRAVTKGQFVMGSVSADAMYLGEYHSYSGAGKVVVE